jgi:redox-sensitive bicupin YhaK (pirin superfamily)
VTRQPGIVTFSCFASGAHYDPGNLSFGALLAVDEHLLEPGAGFADHRHRGVDLVTYVRSGTLRHEDDNGTDLLHAGEFQVQHAGGGIRHSETNASPAEPLRIVQMALLTEDDATGRERAVPPVRVPAGILTAVADGARLPPGRRHLHVLAGTFSLEDTSLGPGDTVRSDGPIRLEGAGAALLWTLENPR